MVQAILEMGKVVDFIWPETGSTQEPELNSKNLGKAFFRTQFLPIYVIFKYVTVKILKFLF